MAGTESVPPKLPLTGLVASFAMKTPGGAVVTTLLYWSSALTVKPNGLPRSTTVGGWEMITNFVAVAAVTSNALLVATASPEPLTWSV